ncbi:MAG: 3-deoxy-manno-octulosonate cytidylyltransferase [bacterium]|nr:3-deoxy-manno-octulosonate cytidylyltransferase [bacterium]
MSVLVLIPARMGATRLPGKPLIDIGGQSLIGRVCHRARQLKNVADICVATDHPEIHDHVRNLGFSARMTSEDHRSGTDRIAEAVGDWSGLVLNLQGDEPLFDIASLDRLIARMESDESIPMGTIAVPLDAGDLPNPDRVKALRGEDGFAVDFRRTLEADPGHEIRVLRHAGVYLYRPECLRRFVATPPVERELEEKLEQLRALALGISIWIEEGRDWPPGVDRPDDLKIIAKLLDDE